MDSTVLSLQAPSALAMPKWQLPNPGGIGGRGLVSFNRASTILPSQTRESLCQAFQPETEDRSQPCRAPPVPPLPGLIPLTALSSPLTLDDPHPQSALRTHRSYLAPYPAKHSCHPDRKQSDEEPFKSRWRIVSFCPQEGQMCHRQRLIL